MNIISISLIIGFLFIPHVFAQPRPADILVAHMRFIHSQLATNIDDVIKLVKSNNIVEAVNLLEGAKIKVQHMINMFDDVVWAMSNRGSLF
jgi:hypothetical protein